MNLLITICARGGSKGIPGKNIRPLNGVPLIAYSIRHAQAFAAKHGGDIALSTDDAAIRAAAAQEGIVTTYERPAKLATDTAGKPPVIQDLLFHEETTRAATYDTILDLDVSSPMRTQDDLDGALALFASRPDALNLFSVSPARRHPSFNMVEDGQDGFVHFVRPPASPLASRQLASPVWDLNASFYFYRRAFFEREPLLMMDKAIAYPLPHPCFDLDEEIDFAFLSFLLQTKSLGFPL